MEILKAPLTKVVFFCYADSMIPYQKSFIFFLVVILSFLILFFFGKGLFLEKKSWNPLVVSFEEYVDTRESEKFLYKIETEKKDIYLATNQTLQGKNIRLIHTSSFWDPEICAGMQTLILDNFIVSKEARLEPEKNGSLSYVYSFYIYDKKNQKIEHIKIPSSEKILSPIFTNKEDVFYFFSKRDNSLFLNKTSLASKKIIQRTLDEIPTQDSLEIIKDKEGLFILAFNHERKKTTFTFSEEVLTPTTIKENLYKNIVTPLSTENKNSVTTQTGKYTIFTPKTFKVKFLGEETAYGYFEIFNLVNFSDFSVVRIKKEAVNQEILFKNTSPENNFSHLILGTSENTTSF
jgi:hypothetical protein